VYFRGVTWLRDSHGLFDYESRNISKRNIRTGQSGRVIRINDEIEYITTEDSEAIKSEEKDVKGILKIMKQDKSE